MKKYSATTFIPSILLSSSLLLSGSLYSNHSSAFEITPILGFRGGGEFVSEADDKKHTAQSSEMYGVIFSGSPYNQGKLFEVYYSHQSTDIKSINLATPKSTSADVPLTIDYLHFGGTAPITDGQESKVSTFVSGGLGFTYMRPDYTGLQSEMRASFSLGLGLKMPISERLAFRLETRLLATLFNSNGSIFCSGGCTIKVNGSAFYQGEAFAGLVLKF